MLAPQCGPDAVSRHAIGLVIATGLTIGALISLYVVPVTYSYIAVDKRAAQPLSDVALQGGAA